MAEHMKPLWKGISHAFQDSKAPPLPEAPPVIHPNSSFILLGYLARYLFLQQFGQMLGWYSLLASILQAVMVGLPITATLIGFDLSAFLLNLFG